MLDAKGNPDGSLSHYSSLQTLEYDWFAPLLGDWDFDYFDGYDKDCVRQVNGEWLFRRALNGAGIQDLFICPSRQTMHCAPQPDDEYGTAIRMFNSARGCYDTVYCCQRQIRRLTFVKEGDKLVGTLADNPLEKWVFSEIAQTSFHWQNVMVLPDGAWNVNSDVFAGRRAERV